MTHPGQGNPDIIEPAGPTDPQVGVLGCWDADGQVPRLHRQLRLPRDDRRRAGSRPTTSTTSRRRSAGSWANQAVVVFLPGAAGDVTQVDNRSPHQIKQFGEVSARFVGGRVGAEARQGAAGDGARGRAARPRGRGDARPQDQAPAAQPRAPGQGPRAREEGSQDGRRHRVDLRQGDRGAGRPDRARAGRGGRGPGRAGRARRVPGLPRRVLLPVRPGPEGGRKFPFTFPVSLANDAIGYVPTEEALGPRGGGYETRLTSYSNLEPAAGRQIADALVELSAGFKPGAGAEAPCPAPVPGPAVVVRQPAAAARLRRLVADALREAPLEPIRREISGLHAPVVQRIARGHPVCERFPDRDVPGRLRSIRGLARGPLLGLGRRPSRDPPGEPSRRGRPTHPRCRKGGATHRSDHQGRRQDGRAAWSQPTPGDRLCAAGGLRRQQHLRRRSAPDGDG